MTAGQALVAAVARLRGAGVPDPARDARKLLAHAARIEASRVTLIAPDELEPEIEANFQELIALRETRVPVSHLVGERAFYGRLFTVSQNVLDPRPETEILIEAALAEPFAQVLDLGTGSGCILVTLLAERESAVGTGVDLSEAACLVAASNAVRHDVAARSEFLLSDWFASVDGQFDLIVSNPPYIAQSELPELAPEVREHEPLMALTDGADGLSAYRLIAVQAGAFLAPGGRILVEIGPSQGDSVKNLFVQAGFARVSVLPDLDGRDRVVVAEGLAR